MEINNVHGWANAKILLLLLCISLADTTKVVYVQYKKLSKYRYIVRIVKKEG